MVEKETELEKAEKFLVHVDSDIRHQTLGLTGQMIAKSAQKLIVNYVHLLKQVEALDLLADDGYQEYYKTDKNGSLTR